MGWLLDTNVISESSKSVPDPEVLAWIERHDHEIHLSTISLGEIVKGIELLAPGRRKSKVEEWFGRIERWAGPRLLAPTAEVMKVWGKLCARCEKAGRPLSVLDSLIAATALTHHLTVATRNTGHFPNEVDVLNPWN